MQTVARLRWAILMLCAFVSAAGAQVTGPITTRQTFVEFNASNLSGNLLSSFAISGNYDRPDTLKPGRVTAVVVDTGKTSNYAVVDFSFLYGGGSKGNYRDTVLVWNEIHIPKGANQSDMPDSLLTLVLTNETPTAGERFEIVFAETNQDQGYTSAGFFSNDTVKGTKPDTSAALYVGRGAMDVSLGFSPFGDTTAATYTVMYNNGFGWGMSVPIDTLADSTFTWQSITSLRYVDAGELLPAPWIKLIRQGTRAADTTTVKEFIRVEPK